MAPSARTSGEAAQALVLLLPARRHFAGQAVSPAIARALGRAVTVRAEAGELAQLRRPFRPLPAGHWPSAVLIEALERPEQDLRPFLWLRADPVWLRPDLGTARLMAWANLGLAAEEADALAAPLRPLFGEFGHVLVLRGPEAWVLQCPPETRLPAFPHPLAALGDDAFPHLPQGPEARRWRSLLGEAQMLLHQHPVNAERQRRGLPPANSLWFWGGGRLPDRVEGPAGRVATADPELAAYARAAGAEVGTGIDATRPGLIDLRAERRWAAVEALVALGRSALGQGVLTRLVLDFADGEVLHLMRSQRWHVWKPPYPGFPA